MICDRSIVKALSNTAALATLFQDIPASVLSDLETDEKDAIDFVCFLLYDLYDNIADVPAVIADQGDIDQGQFVSDLQASAGALTDFFNKFVNDSSEAVQNALYSQCDNDPAVSSAFADQSTITTTATTTSGPATTTTGPCDDFAGYTSGCGITDTDQMLATADEECLCYYEPTDLPTVTIWEPGVFDGYASACAAQGNDDASAFTGYCSGIGDILGVATTSMSSMSTTSSSSSKTSSSSSASSSTTSSRSTTSAMPQATPTTAAGGTQTQASFTSASATPTGAASGILVPGLDSVVMQLSGCVLVALFIL